MVVITGHCASLIVSGAKNVITVDATDTINASGFENQITYDSRSPSIDKSGELISWSNPPALPAGVQPHN
jgi:Protein of unknown function (DUF3060)